MASSRVRRRRDVNRETQLRPVGRLVGVVFVALAAGCSACQQPAPAESPPPAPSTVPLTVPTSRGGGELIGDEIHEIRAEVRLHQARISHQRPGERDGSTYIEST